MPKRYIPCGDFVLIREVRKDVTEGGIAIPEIAQAEQGGARVVAVGPGRVTENGHLIEPRVKQGDLIVIHGGEGVGKLPPIAGDANVYAICRESQICAIIEESEDRN